ncbi:hypothetical protein FBZ82_1352 [Azospirillum brasilense]|uniref:Uncharacterized protein n=1 Tax=Azospirillum brasilense TaxID=192 RepID=A0A560AE19_AZOBR|nr:hypothetical protein [Azospirillum brasilense]TWA58585.1 hypothetical protein FBZ82_1352 [Azospirillum brasilense]
MTADGSAGLLEDLLRALAERDGAARRLAAVDDRIRELSARLLGREAPLPLPSPPPTPPETGGLPAPGARRTDDPPPPPTGPGGEDDPHAQRREQADTIQELEARNEELAQALGRHLVTLAQAEDNVGRLFQRIDALERDAAETSHRLAELGAGVENRDRQIARLVLDAVARGVALRPDGFDEEAYLAHNPDIRAALQGAPAGRALEHWLRWGVQEGRRTQFRRLPINGQ